MHLQAAEPDIQTIVSRIQTGELDLQPDFQRGEVWSPTKKKKLIDSILRNWHVPPVHVVVTPDGAEEVLDGQQRLAAIRDFVAGSFSIDGKIEPLDDKVQVLHGKRYTDLPVDVRRAFDRFTIRIFRLTDYKPEEPGELFFRLNQIVSLTAAEQRNAFYGPARNQVRALVRIFENAKAETIFGFSNRRMAFDDLISKLLCALEEGNIAGKITASDVSDKYRSPDGFSEICVARARSAIQDLSAAAASISDPLKLNKATLFSWLIFTATLFKAGPSHSDIPVLADYIRSFESRRAENAVFSVLETLGEHPTSRNSVERELFRLFVDRSSSRVSDVSSVVLRDFVLWWFFIVNNDVPASLSVPTHKLEVIQSLENEINLGGGNLVETLEDRIDFKRWGAI